MELPVAPEEGQEPPPVDEERKEREFVLYREFSTKHLGMVEQIAGDY